MSETYITNILQLRLLIGFLGERTQYAWWPTGFFEPASRAFLEPVFAKTYRLAQYHGVIEAARLLHDEHLNVGSYHLFRLPEELEQDLHAIMQSTTGQELTAQSTVSKDFALTSLKSLSAAKPNLKVGPTALGSIKDIDSAEVLKLIAAAYLAAFSQSAHSYPYLVG